VEITEGLMMNPTRSTDLAFLALNSVGVHVSVDDFGTGYSGLGYLKRFPVSELKLDRSFVGDLEQNRGDQALATAVIRIGQSLDLRVVAEGVETVGQLDFLASMRCDVAQGYLFSKALTPAELVDWIAASRRTSPYRRS
jgi:EAL domain-containing protein (putative c-di-GMP-specific phosphodiesterase class I)